MSAINLNLALIAIKILVPNDDQKDQNMVDVEFAYAEQRSDGKAKVWKRGILSNIYITGRALKKLRDPKEDGYKYDVLYMDVNNSKDPHKNPFCLMRKHRINEDGKSEAHYYLKCVEEMGSYTTEDTMPNGDIVSTRIFRPSRPNIVFKRYENSYKWQKKYYDRKQAELAKANAQ
jgi:hypothetical protein